MKHSLRVVAEGSASKGRVCGWSLCLAAMLVLFTAVSSAVAQQGVYVITRAGIAGAFTAKMNDNVVTTNADISALLDTIRVRSYGNPVTIQLGAGGAKDTLQLGTLGMLITSQANVRPKWGEITLTGTVKKTDGSSDLIQLYIGSQDAPELIVKSSANMIDVGTSGYTVYTSGRVSLAVTGGEILSSATYVVRVGESTLFEMTGGTVKSTRESGGYAVYLTNNGTVNITGGKVVGPMGRPAVYGSGKASISGNAEIEGNADAGIGIVQITGVGNVEVSGGTIANLADGGNAVYLGSATATFTLSGNTPPKITGSISSMAPGSIIASSFNPGTNDYWLAPRSNARVDSAVVVVGAGAHLSRFKYANMYYELFKKGDDIGVRLKSGVDAQNYILTDVFSNGVYQGIRVERNGKSWKTSNDAGFMNEMREDADGRPCNIQFGNGTTALEGGGSVAVTINQLAGNGWGRVTLSGKLTTKVTRGVYIYNGASVSSSLEVLNDGAYDVYVSSGSDYTHTGGTLHNSGISVYTGSSVAITGGAVRAVTVSGTESSLAVTGGTVGHMSLESRAIYVNSGTDVVISGTASIVSIDTSSGGGTIINNGGTLTVSGGAVSNLALTGGRAIYSNGKSAEVTISGGNITARNGRNVVNTLGVIANVNGSVMEISGGNVTNDQTNGTTVFNHSGKLTISGTADIYKAGTSGQAVLCYGSEGDSTSVTNIIGGRVRAEFTTAVQNNSSGAIATISGTADVTSAGTYAVYAGSGAYINILGGKVTNTSDSGSALFCGMQASPGWLTLGGSPTIDGNMGIRMGYTYIQGSIVAPTEITILTSGENAFVPGDKVYKLEMHVNGKKEGRVMLINGAHFVQNFALDTSRSNTGTTFRLAANGNDAVATQNKVCEVSFSLDGAAGKAPNSFFVMEGGTIGSDVKPSTSPYISKSGFKNDGEWHVLDQSGGAGEVFEFSSGTKGKSVLTDIKLTLSWTDIVSVLGVSRDVPNAPKQETAIIAPIVIPAGELTVGPNPVAKHAGAVSFFWSGAAVTGGKLLVYDASGSLVKKINVSGGGKGAAASWDLTNALGAPVASGTYVARGVITTKGGKSEKVSVLLGVR